MLPDKIYNYYALMAAVLNIALSVDDAISKFSPPTEKHKGRARKFDSTAIEEMIRLRGYMTNRQIGDIYGISKQAVSLHIHRYRQGGR